MSCVMERIIGSTSVMLVVVDGCHESITRKIMSCEPQIGPSLKLSR